jgi:hypothetical protein
MDNHEHPTGAEAPPTLAKEHAKTKKQLKEDPQTFVANWRQALTSEEDPVPKLRTMLRVGFQGEVTNEHITQLVSSLAEHRAVVERLALPLAVQERYGKLKPLARRLLAEFRTLFERGINYNVEEFSGYLQYLPSLWSRVRRDLRNAALGKVESGGQGDSRVR